MKLTYIRRIFIIYNIMVFLRNNNINLPNLHLIEDILLPP